MIGGPALRPQDRVDFETVLDMALALTDVRAGLRDDLDRNSTTRLRAQALGAAEEIAAAAGAEYRAYCAVRTAVGRRASAPDGRFPAPDGAVWPVLAVLVPAVSAVAAAALLLIGYGLRLVGQGEGFAASVVTAGWMLALVAAVTTAAGLWALLLTALRGRDEPGTASPGARGSANGADVERARERWREALLERGVLPYLRLHLPEPLAP
ncbi:hypothetical protein [Streptomyces coriariae]|uniref:hypothetical protein n=1 Tax=Streptomyces coriariae TaxID=2864460 RepID=UPI001E4C35B3|nr:hypothetical protein [Streptomyces coriariae]